MSAKSSRTKKPSRAKQLSRRRKPSRSQKRRAANAARIIEILFQNEVTPNRYDDSAAQATRMGGRKGGMLLRNVRGWRIAESLQQLLDQVNQMAPGRSKASDGAIGDTSHQSRRSDHNPWVTDGNIGSSRRATLPTIRKTDATPRRSPTRSSPPRIRG